MPVGLLTLAHEHGPVAVVSVLLVYKYAKYRLVCWRRDSVNKEVRVLTTTRLDGGPGSSGLGVEGSGSKPPSECAVCGCPLWLRHDQEECKVVLSECGCVIHSTCLIDLATQQHGMTLPSIFDPGHALVLLRRMFGLEAIAVDSLQCPRCGIPSSSWRRVPEDGAALATLESTAAAARALRRGEALCLEGLRTALLAQVVDKPSPELRSWQAAAKSDASLRAQLRQQGPGAARELAELLLRPAAIAGGGAAAAAAPVREAAGPVAAAGAREESSDPPADGKRAPCRVQRVRCEQPAPPPAAGPAAPQPSDAQRRAYADFLGLG